jgi:hypothetical protein
MLTKVRETRPHDGAIYIALKTASKLAVELAGPTLNEVCRRTRLDPATLSRAGNTTETNFVPIDVAIDLDFLATDPVICRQMARALGYDLVPVSPVPSPTQDLSIHAGHAAKEVGELVSAVVEAVALNKLNPRKAREILDEANDAESVISAIKHVMHGVIAGAGRK